MSRPPTIEIVKLGERFAEKYEATCRIDNDPAFSAFSGCGTVFRYTVLDIDPQSRGPYSTPYVRCPACGRVVEHGEENRVS